MSLSSEKFSKDISESKLLAVIQKLPKRIGERLAFDVKDLEHWEAQATAVLLAVWDVQQKRGWWIWINHAIEFLSQSNAGWRGKSEVNVHIQLENEFSEDGLKQLRKLLADLYSSLNTP